MSEDLFAHYGLKNAMKAVRPINRGTKLQDNRDVRLRKGPSTGESATFKSKEETSKGSHEIEENSDDDNDEVETELFSFLDSYHNQRYAQQDVQGELKSIYDMICRQEFEEAVDKITKWESEWEQVLGKRGMSAPYNRYAASMICECALASGDTHTYAQDLAQETLDVWPVPVKNLHPHDQQVIEYLRAVSQNERITLPKACWDLDLQPPNAISTGAHSSSVSETGPTPSTASSNASTSSGKIKNTDSLDKHSPHSSASAIQGGGNT